MPRSARGSSKASLSTAISAWPLASFTAVEVMFITGEPINCATKRLAGWR
jgi:hypothetical protein